MRKTAGILLIAMLLLSSCSAQRRLERLMLHHPELRTADSLHVVNLTTVIPGATNTILLPHIENDPCNCDSLLRDALKDGISTTAGKAQASLVPTDSGIALQAQQLPDTIIIKDTVNVPVYVVKTAPREETKLEIFFRYLGYFTAAIALVLLVIFIVKCFV